MNFQENLNVSEGQAEEFLFCFCRESNVPMDYSKFARGRSFYKKKSKSPNSFDTALDSEASPTPLANYLRPPSSDSSHHYPPLREITISPHPSLNDRYKVCYFSLDVCQ